jgi:hypothetical protein
MQMTLVADKLDIGKNFKMSGQHYGKLCDPVVYELENGKFVLKAETYQGCADVALIDYYTSDYHLFNTKQEAINAWVGTKPKGSNWNH